MLYSPIEPGTVALVTASSINASQVPGKLLDDCSFHSVSRECKSLKHRQQLCILLRHDKRVCHGVIIYITVAYALSFCIHVIHYEMSSRREVCLVPAKRL